MYSGLLPIGSVVRLQGESTPMMISGYFPVGQSRPDYVWDYIGVVFPGGCLNTNQTYQFDKEQIEELVFIGYEDEEQREFIMELNVSGYQIKNAIIDEMPKKGDEY